jgi:hypothetical protein
MKFKVIVVDLELPPRVKKWATRAVVALAIFAGAAAAYAETLVTWTSGQTLTADDLNKNFALLQGQVAAITPNAHTGVVTVGGNPVILWQEFATPKVLEFGFAPTTLHSTQVIPMLPTGARYILADVFATANANDQQNFWIGRGVVNTPETWVTPPGTQPSTLFGDVAKHAVMLNYPGQNDAYTSFYGIWYSSQVIPLNANGTFDFATTGNSGSSGWLYLIIKSYSL